MGRQGIEQTPRYEDSSDEEDEEQDGYDAYKEFQTTDDIEEDDDLDKPRTAFDFKADFDTEFSEQQTNNDGTKSFITEEENFPYDKDLLEAVKSHSSKSPKNRFLRPFSRFKRKKSNKAKKAKQTSWSLSNTPPRNSMSKPEQDPTNSPSSVMDPALNLPSQHFTIEKEISVDHTPLHKNGFSSQDATREMNPTDKGHIMMVEEVEVLRKRKEPIYSSYVRTQSNVMEGVEVLRKESNLLAPKSPPRKSASLEKQENTVAATANTSSSSNNNYNKEWKSKEEEEEEPGKIVSRHLVVARQEEKEEEPGPIVPRHKRLDRHQQRKKRDEKPVYIVELGKESSELEQVHAPTASPLDPKLDDITSRLAKEAEESERMREMLQKKDQDLEQLEKLLHEYEYSTILERVASSATKNAKPESDTMITNPSLEVIAVDSQ